jgi:lysophospholipase L1-like esterase
MNVIWWQTKYILGVGLILPFAPLLYLQGRYVRRKVGLLPDAAGEKNGVAGKGEPGTRLLVIGESTVAGLGARTHETALAGQFAKHLGAKIDRSVQWNAIGKNGVTAARTIKELLPLIEGEGFDYILIGLGGNDVLKLSSPVKWRKSMLRLISLLRENSPDATIFITNVAAVHLSPALPQPIRGILWQLSRLHNANIVEFVKSLKNVFYYPQPTSVPDDFFSDGIHPSEAGYAVWSKDMVDTMLK